MSGSACLPNIRRLALLDRRAAASSEDWAPIVWAEAQTARRA